MISKPELLLNARADLGEGPAWVAASGLLYWVDLRVGWLHVFRPKDKTDLIFDLGESVGCLAPRRSGGLVLGLRSGFALLDGLSFPRIFSQKSDCPTTRLEPLKVSNPEPDRIGNRFNDGKCDPAGRFVAGTMDDAEKEATGSLYSFGMDGKARCLLSGVRISNGLAWSPDYHTFYFIDTPTRTIMAYDYLLTCGGLANPRPLITIPVELGWPDGMTSDTEGMLWVAMWGGASLTRWNPLTGKMLRQVTIPAWNVTSCVFGGPDMTDLYVTTARKDMTPEQLRQYPLSGGLFRLQTNIHGMPTFEYGG